MVAHRHVERRLSDVLGVPAFLASQGVVAGTRVLATKITAPDWVTRNALKLGPNDFVVDIRRLRMADGSPLSLDNAQFPAAIVPGLLEQQLGGSIYEVLEHVYGLTVARAEERIEAVNATADEASLLGITPESALLLITRVAYDRNGNACEFSRDLFRGDRTCLAISTQGHGVRGDHHRSTASVALRADERT